MTGRSHTCSVDRDVRRAVCLIAFIPLLTYAQSGVWGCRGISHRFISRGNFVFAADGRGVAAYDVSQANVRRVAIAETEGQSLDLAFLSDRQLAVATRAGINLYAVASDGSLTPLTTYPDAIATVIASNGRFLAGVTPIGIAVWRADTMNLVTRLPITQPASLAWHGDTLIAAVEGIGLHIFDLTSAREPSIVAENARDVVVAGNTLYVAAGVNGLVVYDITDDSAPRLLSRTAAGEMNFARIALSDRRIFVAELPDRVDVFDITSATPALTARFTEPVQAIAASGMRLFVSGTIIDRFGLPTETGAPLRIFDATDPATPRFTGEFRDLAGPVSGVATDGSLAYVVDPPYFRIIDVSTTTAPRELSSLPIDGIGDYAKVSGNQAIVYGRSDVQLIDVGNPYAPKLLKVFHALGGPPSTAAFARNTILEGNPYSGFHVIDFSNFADPAQIGGIKGHYFDVLADGDDVAYLVQEASLIVTVDLSDVHNPRPLKSAIIGAVRGELANATEHHPPLLIVQALSGIHVYTLADPRSPVEADFTPTAAVNIIGADGDVAYLATAGSVQAMDLTNPARPTLLPTQMRPVSPMQLSAAAGKVVVADRYALRIFGPNTAPPPPPPPTRRRAAGH